MFMEKSITKAPFIRFKVKCPLKRRPRRQAACGLFAGLFLLLLLMPTACGTASDPFPKTKSSLPLGQTQFAKAGGAKYSPLNAPAVRDYTLMWWKNGVFTKEKELRIQTGNYGLTWAAETGKISRLGAIQAEYTETAASQMGEEVIDALPALPDVRYLLQTAAGWDETDKAYPEQVQGEMVRFTDERATAVRFIDSGTWLQRADLMQLKYRRTGRTRARLELSCAPDQARLTYQTLFMDETPAFRQAIEFTLPARFNKAELLWGRAFTVFDDAFSGYIFLLPADGSVSARLDAGRVVFEKSFTGAQKQAWLGFTVGIVPAANITQSMVYSQVARESVQISTDMLAPVAQGAGNVHYNALTGAYILETPNSDLYKYFGAESTMNQYERMKTTLHNPAAVPVSILVNFNKPYHSEANYNDTGQSPMLRDAETGQPLGHKVMVSRNPHVYPVNPAPLYNATWANFYTFITLQPGQTLTVEFTMAYAKWGTVYAASQAHLSLVGWGGNQSWIVSSLGAFGEAFCYDPDVLHDRAIGCDSHALAYLPNSYGNLKEYVWSQAAAGHDYFVYYNEEGLRQRLVNLKVSYPSYSPNLAEMTFNARTQDGKVSAALTFSLGRTDDVARVYQRFRYTFLENVSYARLAFYQSGADKYNGGAYFAAAYGNAQGLLTTMETNPYTDAASGYLAGYENMDLREGFWFHKYKNGAFNKDGTPNTTPNVSTGFAVRSYSAVINGVSYTSPLVSFHRTQDEGACNLIADLVPNTQGEIQAGSTIEGVIEYFVLPQVKSSYYGQSEYLKSLPEAYFNSYRILEQYAKKGAVSVAAEKGQVLSQYPVKIAAEKEGNARFRITGGLTYVPVTITGLPTYENWRLYEISGGGATQIDQSVLGNDYWQCDYNPQSKTYALTFNVLHNGDAKTYELRKA